MFKWIAAFFGFLAFKYIGAILGYFVGSIIDRAIRLGVGAVNPLSAQQRQAVFLKTAFSLMGRLAKVDGHISANEIAQAESFMDQMGMTPDHRRQAIDYFKAGAATDYDIKAQLAEFMASCGQTRNLKQVLLSYLIAIALADGVIAREEEQLLKDIAVTLGFSIAEFEKLMQMIRAQSHFAGGQSSNSNALEDAYTALGVSADDSDQSIKRAYRSLISKYHPDKLIGQGMPEDMIKSATARTQEIQTAYDLIKSSRGK